MPCGSFSCFPLFGELLLQCRIDQRHRNAKGADFELGGIEGDVPVLGTEVSGKRDVNVFARDFGEELAACDIAIELYLVAFDLCISCSDDRIR